MAKRRMKKRGLRGTREQHEKTIGDMTKYATTHAKRAASAIESGHCELAFSEFRSAVEFFGRAYQDSSWARAGDPDDGTVSRLEHAFKKKCLVR